VKLHLASAAGRNLFSGYGTGYVSVNNVRYACSVVVTPEAVSEWKVGGFDALTAADFGPVVNLGPEVVIFGTGSAQRFPRSEIARLLVEQGIGFEVMDSSAACRTYNILAAEGRKVAAAILID